MKKPYSILFFIIWVILITVIGDMLILSQISRYGIITLKELIALLSIPLLVGIVTGVILVIIAKKIFTKS